MSNCWVCMLQLPAALLSLPLPCTTLPHSAPTQPGTLATPIIHPLTLGSESTSLPSRPLQAAPSRHRPCTYTPSSGAALTAPSSENLVQSEASTTLSRGHRFLRATSCLTAAGQGEGRGRWRQQGRGGAGAGG